ncbi:MAG: bifunctional methionine sulfoxide reductase B/A protein [Candidatus Methanolliviera hydrocarbonicum]|uniref:Peptide methionine sulfoxide reductase MsrA n=1 Tax=Candidatus Methanolliviera hydrocarbonicum TaxID=2491085 RepID=A0A520KXE0_9EURY|nr:MAG: bifunctional methionine sulfoxide reductase B/A protein [Candidatus Methanolliviera hydrocarbonicum]
MIIFIGLLLILLANSKEVNMGKNLYNELLAEEERVIIHKGTERPFSGKYNNFFKNGTYHCKRCDAPLYRSQDKFSSTCGWPSFDDEIKEKIRKEMDVDGIRTEILCANCGAHLGHIFTGEKLTEKDVRHCVNSLSLKFVEETNATQNEKAYFAGGCFWGVEYHFERKEGVISAISGYMGGTQENPSYQDVCYKNTGHLEVVEVTYNPSKVSYETLAKLFFEIHDPEQANGQGPDIGEQYTSAIFYNNDSEKEIAEKLIEILETKGYTVVTRLMPSDTFWRAEEYHQDYYKKNKSRPYCHVYQKRF